MTWLRKGTPFFGARTDMQFAATGSPVETAGHGICRRKVTRQSALSTVDTDALAFIIHSIVAALLYRVKLTLIGPV